MTCLTQLCISSPDYQAASGSLQCLSALRQLRDLHVTVIGRQGKSGLATVPPLSRCTALTRLRNLYVPTEVRTNNCILHAAHFPAGPGAAARSAS
jgi:hypothetical protein